MVITVRDTGVALDQHEKDNLQLYLIARVYKSLLQSSAPTWKIANLLSYSSDGLKEPFQAFNALTSLLYPKHSHIVITIDDLTTALDQLTLEQRKCLVKSVEWIVHIQAPRVSIVLTGTRPLDPTFLYLNLYFVRNVYLPEYRAAGTLPLLKVLVGLHEHHGAPFPCVVWQCCKTNAGMLAFLVQQARKGNCFATRGKFFDAVAGIFQLPPVSEYWSLVENFISLALRPPYSRFLLHDKFDREGDEVQRKLPSAVIRCRERHQFVDPIALIGVTRAPQTPIRDLLLEVVDACDPRITGAKNEHPRFDCSWFTLAVVNLRSHVLSGETFSTVGSINSAVAPSLQHLSVSNLER